MPIYPDQAETANNRDAEAGMPQKANNPAKNRLTAGGGNANGEVIQGEGNSQDAERLAMDARWLQMTRMMKAAAEQQLSTLRNVWADNYRAINNKHASGSKYNASGWRGRSQLHRPKTRTAVEKADAGAANALFATSDVVAIEPGNPLDERDKASAAINKALLNYRLDRKSGKAGIPWFQIAVGAHNDTKATGICISKQYWEHRTRTIQEQVATMDENTGQPVLDEATGRPLITTRNRIKIIRDRPMVRLYPPELVLRDPGADWLDQAQDSAFIGLMNPLTIGDWIAMARDPQTKIPSRRYRDVLPSILQKARIGGTSQVVNTARESNGQQQREGLTTGVEEFDRFWGIEWFVRYQGEEWNYWTAGASDIIADIMATDEAYPEFDGERPIVIGLGNIEPHKIDPMSMVQSVQPLQMEMNDLVNMRLDGVKESIRPLTMVKRGKKIDIKSIQQRSGDTAVYVQDKDDISFDRPGSIGSESYAEMSNLNVDFDDAVGQFNGGSVSTNRQLNETVGGMNLLNQSANIVGDFKLRVWIETWVEPVLRQLVRLEQYYEDDQVILAVAGQKAKLYQRHGVSTIDDDLINRELFISVSAGIGNSDPMVKLDKFAKVAQAAGTLLGQGVQDRAKQDEVINELFGAAGFRDAAERFFHEGDQTDQRIVKLQEYVGQLEAQVKEKQTGLDNQLQVERIKSATTLVGKFLDNIQKERTAEQQAINAAASQGRQDAVATRKGEADRKHQSDMASMKVNGPPPAKPKGKVPAPVDIEEDPQEQAVEEDLGLVSQAFLKSMLPALMQDIAPKAMPQQMQAQPQPQLPMPVPQAPPPAPLPAGPAGADPMVVQVMMGMQQMMQQQTAMMQMLAQSIDGLRQAQMAPKTARKNEDGTITMMPMAAAPQALQ